MVSLEKWMIVTPLQKLPKNGGGGIGAILLLPNALKSFPKSNKSPNLVTLLVTKSILTYRGSITLWLTPCFTILDSAAFLMRFSRIQTGSHPYCDTCPVTEYSQV